MKFLVGIKQFLIETYTRFKLHSPDYMKKMQKISLVLAGFPALATAAFSSAGLPPDPIIIEFDKFCVYFGLGMYLVSNATVARNQPPEKEKLAETLRQP